MVGWSGLVSGCCYYLHCVSNYIKNNKKGVTFRGCVFFSVLYGLKVYPVGTGEPVEQLEPYKTMIKYTDFMQKWGVFVVWACGSVALYLAILGAFVSWWGVPCLALFSCLYGEIPGMMKTPEQERTPEPKDPHFAERPHS